MNGTYPTKEQILEKEILFKLSTIKVVKEWKEKHYSNGLWETQDRNDSIKALLNKLGESYEKPVSVESDYDSSTYYDIASQTIHVNSRRPSIISALHEFAHHLFGPNERRACRWSVWLFKKTFPKEYERLEFSGHMLKKKNEP